MKNGIKQNVNIPIEKGKLALKTHLTVSLETDSRKKKNKRNTPDNTLVADLSVLAQKSRDGLKRF